MEKNSCEYTLVINRERIPVSGEVYKAYYRHKEHENYLDRLSRRYNLPFSECEENGSQFEYLLSYGENTIEETVIRREITERLKSALEALSYEESELIKYIYFDGISERALAQKMNIPQKTINNRKKRLLKKIKKFIEN